MAALAIPIESSKEDLVTAGRPPAVRDLDTNGAGGQWDGLRAAQMSSAAAGHFAVGIAAIHAAFEVAAAHTHGAATQDDAAGAKRTPTGAARIDVLHGRGEGRCGSGFARAAKPMTPTAGLASSRS